MDQLPTHVSYDDVPYDGGIISASHPQAAAVLGRLFGMEPAPVESARVLEIGCGIGSNLLPMAYALPGARFLGIDLSRRHIEIAGERRDRLGVTNVRFEHEDARQLGDRQEEFDYIICHGVFSWVPEDVRAAILANCRRLLAPQGIAYISYNTLPGWHFRGSVREMMRFHARYFPETGARVEQARALLDFLTSSTERFAETSPGMDAYHRVLSMEEQVVRERPDYYVFHEHLEAENHPFYLHEFAEQAQSRGLQYLGDASFSSMLPLNLPDDIAATLNEISRHQLALEQYRDFLLNRMFRQSLLCRDDVSLTRHIDNTVIAGLAFRGLLSRGEDGWSVPRAGGMRRPVTDRDITAVLDTLAGAAPACLGFDALQAAVNGGPAGTALDRDRLAAILLTLFAHDAIEMRTWVPEVARTVPERPAVFAPARLQEGSVYGPYHWAYVLLPVARPLVPLLDGTRTKSDLVDEVAKVYTGEDLQGFGIEPSRRGIEALVDELLAQFCRMAVLEP